MIRALVFRREFTRLRLLGSGKDGVTYLCQDTSGNRLVVKVLSAFGKQYLPVTKELIKRNVSSEFLYPLQLKHNSFVIYPYEELIPIKTDFKSFLPCLRQICDVETDLLDYGICYWDFGFVDHCNYMLNAAGKIKLIDYGGNSFLLIDGQPLQVKGARKNLVYASNLFMQVQTLLHIYYYGLGRRTKILLSTASQHDDEQQLNKHKDFCVREMQETVYGDIVQTIAAQDLLSAAGWHHVAQSIDRAIAAERGTYDVQEGADVQHIEFKKDVIMVRGYQSYDISREVIIPQASNQSWDTREKFALVEQAMDRIFAQTTPKSFLDIGSNLGIYVFLARLRYHMPLCVGVDYNKKYIDICKNMQASLGIEHCSFLVQKFSEIRRPYDIVLAFGLIHHLFHRTEEYGSLKDIVATFARITGTFLILEFPTELDAKAAKWTNIPGRAKTESYSLQNFLDHARHQFREVIELGRIYETRIVYLLIK